MKASIDTHALIWAVDEPERLGSEARAITDDSRNKILFSSGSIWELAIKIGLGKLTLSLPFDVPLWPPPGQSATGLFLTLPNGKLEIRAPLRP